MKPRPWPAKTAPARSTSPPKIASPVLTGVITCSGYGSRCLQPAVDDRFLFGVLEEGLDAVLLAEARLLGAAEGKLVVGDLQGVDPRVTGLQLVHGTVGGRHVGRPDR